MSVKRGSFEIIFDATFLKKVKFEVSAVSSVQFRNRNISIKLIERR